MTTLEFVHFKRSKCKPGKKKAQVKKVEAELHSKIGRLLNEQTNEYKKMDINRPQLLIPPSEQLTYLF